jgi:hypothetical protein
LQNKFKFKKAVIKDEGGGLDDEGDDMGDEMEGNADIADIANMAGGSDDEIEDFAGEFGDKNNDADNI